MCGGGTEMNKAPRCPPKGSCLVQKGVVPTSNHHMGDGLEWTWRVLYKLQVVEVTEGSQVRFHGLNLHELVKADVWTRAFKPTWH